MTWNKTATLDTFIKEMASHMDKLPFPWKGKDTCEWANSIHKPQALITLWIHINDKDPIDLNEFKNKSVLKRNDGDVQNADEYWLCIKLTQGGMKELEDKFIDLLGSNSIIIHLSNPDDIPNALSTIKNLEKFLTLMR